MKIVPPSLRIHAWGGLGSQLYAVALAEDLRKRFRKRRIVIVLHTGGVTRRIPEVVSLFPYCDFVFEDDFSSGKELITPSGINISNRGKKLFKNFLLMFGVVSSCNNDAQTRSLKPWVLSIRGHYSYRKISDTFLYSLKELITSREIVELDVNTCCIHYRLGDLLLIDKKSPISVNALLHEYSLVSQSYDFSNVYIFSDSPEEAFRRFSNMTAEKISAPNASTISVIANSISASYFIGTASKISFWIAGIRALDNQLRSSLPRKNELEFRGLLDQKLALISQYDSELE